MPPVGDTTEDQTIPTCHTRKAVERLDRSKVQHLDLTEGRYKTIEDNFDT